MVKKRKRNMLIVVLTCVMLMGTSMIAYAQTVNWYNYLEAYESDFCYNSLAVKADWEQRAYISPTTNGGVTPSMRVRMASGTVAQQYTNYVNITYSPGRYTTSYFKQGVPGNSYYLRCANGGTYYYGAGRWTP